MKNSCFLDCQHLLWVSRKGGAFGSDLTLHAHQKPDVCFWRNFCSTEGSCLMAWADLNCCLMACQPSDYSLCKERNEGSCQ